MPEKQTLFVLDDDFVELALRGNGHRSKSLYFAISDVWINIDVFNGETNVYALYEIDRLLEWLKIDMDEGMEVYESNDLGDYLMDCFRTGKHCDRVFE